MFEKHGHDGTRIYGHHREERRECEILLRPAFPYQPYTLDRFASKTFHQLCRRRVISITNIFNLVEMHVGIASIEMSCLPGISGGAGMTTPRINRGFERRIVQISYRMIACEIGQDSYG